MRNFFIVAILFFLSGFNSVVNAYQIVKEPPRFEDLPGTYYFTDSVITANIILKADSLVQNSHSLQRKGKFFVTLKDAHGYQIDSGTWNYDLPPKDADYSYDRGAGCGLMFISHRSKSILDFRGMAYFGDDKSPRKLFILCYKENDNAILRFERIVNH